MPRSRIYFQPASTSSGGGGSPTVGNVAWGPDFGESGGADGLSANIGIDVVSATLVMSSTNGPLASKDTWISNVALCPENANHDATDLQVEGVVATRKDIYCGWDLSALPTGVTVSAATLLFNVKTIPTAATGGVDLNHLANADETWSETVITCSTARSLTQFQNDTASWGSTGEKSIVLNATARSRIAARMGAGVYSIVLSAPNTLFTNAVIQSKDSGGSPGNASGPRLALTFTKSLAV